MKKVVALVFCATFLFGLDQSSNSNIDQSIKADKTIGNNKSQTINNSKNKETSDAHATEKSNAKSLSINYDEKTDMLVALLSFEESGIKPFNKCQVFLTPQLSDNFGLSCEMEDGGVNEGRCSFLGSAATSKMLFSKVSSKENELKQYMSCVALYGALIAQDLKHGESSPALTDKALIKVYKKFNQNLDKPCRLNGNLDTVLCGAVSIHLSSVPNLNMAGVSLFSDKDFYGFTSSRSKTRNSSISDSTRDSNSKTNSLADAMSKSLSNNKSLSSNIQQQSSSNLSLSKFIPGD